MNTKTALTLGCICSLFFAVAAFGEGAPTKPETAKIESAQHKTKALDTETLIGKKVESRDGKEIGLVKNIVKNPANGQAYAIVASANKLYPVPVNALNPQPAKETVALSIDKKKFSTAPSYPEDKTPDMTSPAINLLVNQFYSQSPS
jgi:sporulation protein YlmC with PRC-barrel domain